MDLEDRNLRRLQWGWESILYYLDKHYRSGIIEALELGKAYRLEFPYLICNVL